MCIERNVRDSEDDIEELLGAVGPRDAPSGEHAPDVQIEVHAAWREMVAERLQARRAVHWGIAAGLILVALVGTLGTLKVSGSYPPATVATIVRIDGQLLGANSKELWSRRGSRAAVKVRERLRTDNRSRVALALPNGVSVRLDHDTVATFAAIDRIVLTSGAIYVDAPKNAQASASLMVQTPVGEVQHIGTQYQVRVQEEKVEISVREGSVVIRNGVRASTALAGQSVHLKADGAIVQAPITAWDGTWDWAAKVAPRFVIENATLADFLAWVGRETGRHVVYASRQAKAAAHEVHMHGSIDGLDLDTALQAVLATTRLQRYATQDDSIGIATRTD